MTFECIVSADLFRRALSCASDSETRYYLNGVYIEPAPNGGALLTATDGYTLLSLRDPSGRVTGTGIVSLSDALKKELAAKRDVRPRVVMVRGSIGNAIAYVAVCREGKPVEALFDKPTDDVLAAQVSSVLIDGTFPDWRRVVPTELNPAGPVATLNARYIARMGEALSRDAKNPQVVIVPPAGEAYKSSAHVVFGHTQVCDGFGLVMPVHGPGTAPTLPAYLKPVKPKRPASKAPKRPAKKAPAKATKKAAKKRRAA